MKEAFFPNRTLLTIGVAILSSFAITQTFPPKPSQDGIYDGANLISSQDRTRITAISQDFYRSTGAPIVVVTIPSLRDYGAESMGLERYATSLFNTWRIGKSNANCGILLLVAKADRKVRIELGKDWGRAYDAGARKINQTVILPAFKRGDFSSGIREGVARLANLTQEKSK